MQTEIFHFGVDSTLPIFDDTAYGDDLISHKA